MAWLLFAALGRTGEIASAGPDGPLRARANVARPASRSATQPRVLDVDPVRLPAEPPPDVRLSRNPFAFAPRSVPPEPEPAPVPIPPAPAPLPDTPPSLVLSLIGVATTTRADGRAERTAIIAGPANALYMVREADPVAARYRVDAVTPDSVVLADGATGAALRLVLR